MQRIFFFLLTNIAVLLVASITLRLIGAESFLHANGVDLDLGALLVFSAVFGMAGSFVSLLLSKMIAKRSVGAVVIDTPRTPREQWLVARVSQHAQASGIGMPEVAIFESPQPNAFATGARRDAALVAVSTGLLQSMREEEVDAVIGHEIAHIANGDMVTLTLIQGVVNTFVIFLSRIVGTLVDRVLFRSGDDEHHGRPGIGYFAAVMISQVLFGILASMVVSWFSRRREFAADAGGARLAGRGAMIAALERLRAVAHPEPLPQSLAAFGISGGKSLAALFATHPPLEQRIEALRQAS